MLDAPSAAAIAALIEHVPHSCAQIADALGTSRAEVMAAAERLWATKLLQGEVRDGCCQDPCGATCVVARHPDRAWRLSRKGRSALRHYRAATQRP
jgi:predicted ArsR family transcriptional regulator